MRDENEVKVKRAYWQGVHDASATGDRSRSERLERQRVSAKVWLTALDWILGNADESASNVAEIDTSKD